MSDFTYDILFQSILNSLKIGKLNRNVFNVSQIGFLRTIDIVNKIPAIRNQELERVCNSICDWVTAYVPNGDLVNSYALFLNYLNPNTTEVVADSIKKNNFHKRQLENKLMQLIKQHRNEIENNRSKGFINKDNSNAFWKSINRLLQELKETETTYTESAGQGFISVEQAKREVSFLTGARKIDGSNDYNMICSENSPLDKMYLPAYKILAFDDEFKKWKENKRESNYVHEINLTNNSITPIKKIRLSLYGYGIKESNKLHVHVLQHTRICAKFSGLGNFKVEPVNWFHSDFFKDKNFNLDIDAPDFFSKGSALHSTPISLLLGFNIKIEIHLNSDSFKNLNNAISRKGSLNKKVLSIGNNEFCFSGKGKNVIITKNLSEEVIIIEPFSSGLPSLLGVISEKTIYN